MLAVFALTGAKADVPALQLPSGASAQAPAPGAVSNDLAVLSLRQPSRTVEAIVQLQPSATQDLVRAQIAATGGKVFREIPLINGLGVRMSASAAASLANVSGVRAVSLNAKVVGSGFIDPAKLSSA